MEYGQYRTWQRRQRIRGGAAAGIAASAGSYGGSYALDQGMDLGAPGWNLAPLLDLPGDGIAAAMGSAADVPTSILLGLASAGLVAYTTLRERLAATPAAQRRRELRAPGWASLGDLGHYTGTVAARQAAVASRPGLSRWQRWTAPHTELAIPLGTIKTGKRPARGRTMVTTPERGMLVLGEPGTFKSTFLAGVVMDYPGPSMVVSTKDEYWSGLADLRSRTHGPVRIFDPMAPEPHPAEQRFKWNLVAGCRDTAVAQQRAAALMSAASGGGLSNADFWADKGRGLLTALLVAADLDGATLRDVSGWLQREDYQRPTAVLRHHADQVEPHLLGFLTQVSESSAAAASGSTAQTASMVLEFLSSATVAEALAPSDGETDMGELLDSRGTLFLVTQGDASMGPLMAALTDYVTRTVKARVREDGVRQDPPLGVVVDEAHLTMPAVPLHEMAAELRGWGVWVAVSLQNYAQAVEKWGRDAATTMRSSLQTLVVTGAHDEEDRERYSKRVGERTEQHVNDSTPKKALGRGALRWLSPVGHISTTSTRVPVLRPEMLSTLGDREALVIPNRGAAAVVQFPRAWDVAVRRLDAMQRQATSKQERTARREAAAARRRAQQQGGTVPVGAALTSDDGGEGNQ